MDCIETILKKAGDGSLYIEDRRTEVIQITGFSNANEFKPGVETIRHTDPKDDEILKVIDFTHIITVFPKGSDDSTGKFVFLNFELVPDKPLYCGIHEQINCRAEWACLVSLVDSESCLRYPQSVAFIYDGVKTSRYDSEWIKFFSIKSLLRDAEVLLPDDTLTIQVDMVLKQNYAGERCKHKSIVLDDLLHSSFETNSSNGNSRYQRLRLDSSLGKLLQKESRYFERLCTTPMVEKNTGYLEITEEEEETFMNMVEILSHPHVEHESVHIKATVTYILDIYALADFYGIERVLDTCRCWLRLICRSHFSCVTDVEVSEISKLAETHDDPILREIVRGLARNEVETETQSDVEHEPWTCEHVAAGPRIWNEIFNFKLPVKIKKQENATEDVSALSHCYI